MNYKSILLLLVVFSNQLLSGCSSGDGWEKVTARTTASWKFYTLPSHCSETKLVRHQQLTNRAWDDYETLSADGWFRLHGTKIFLQYQTSTEPKTWVVLQPTEVSKDPFTGTPSIMFVDAYGCEYSFAFKYNR